jgi:hypothetical protein
MTSKICKGCGKPFEHHLTQKEYCTTTCRKAHHKQKYAYTSLAPNLSSSNTGAVSELIVCADLLKKGYEVFRSVSATCSCDVIALRDGICTRIEVRSAQIRLDNNGATVPYNAKDFGRQDVVATLTILGDVTYYVPTLADGRYELILTTL